MSSYAASYLPRNISRAFSSSFISPGDEGVSPPRHRCFGDVFFNATDAIETPKKIPTRIRTNFKTFPMAFKSFCFRAFDEEDENLFDTRMAPSLSPPAASSRLAPLVAERPFFFLRETAEGVFSFFLRRHFFRKRLPRKVARAKRDTMPPFHAHHRCLTVSSFLSPLMMLLPFAMVRVVVQSVLRRRDEDVLRGRT